MTDLMLQPHLPGMNESIYEFVFTYCQLHPSKQILGTFQEIRYI